jgi:acyl-CoA synthetase (AMP-forming)/AMP-acid ligase II
MIPRPRRGLSLTAGFVPAISVGSTRMDICTLVGRIKELINRGGEKISPLEIDAAMSAIPGIRAAAAFAIPIEPRRGNRRRRRHEWRCCTY